MAGEGGEAVVQVAVQNLIDVSKNEISLIRGLDREAQNLIQNLDTIQKFLNDAETHTIPSGAVKSCLQRLENAAFEADNVLDELHYHALSKTLNKKKTVLISCFSPFIDYARNRKMAVSVKKIKKDLKFFTERATELGLQKILVNDAPTAPDAGMETDALSADPIFIGRDKVVTEIVETLITSATTHVERVFSILPIVGMGGLGKTTLTRRVFHHQKMDTQFESCIWVHVSQVFDPINLFIKILQALTSSQSYQGETSRQEIILKKLQEGLKDKTYLLVLDDVWDQDISKWKDFLNSLSGVTTTKGNGIIVTTRSMKVASIVGTLHIHHLKGLSEEDCWAIIRAKACGNEYVSSDVQSVGREIAERCGGLPLAASVIGGVLRGKSLDEWYSFIQNWLSEGGGENIITKTLKLSSDKYLSSPSLKKCFAYCSIFPKGEEMAKVELTEMWMGEGFLGSDDMESVGDKFYNALLHSSLLQVAKRDAYGDYKTCVMHDLVHDLASSVLVSSNNADGIGRVRYQLLQQGKSSPITKEVAKHLRTLIFRGDQLSDENIFSDYKCMHVLTIEVNSLEELPRSIRKLIHLRILNISETSIRHLPDWIGELHHLQTLRAKWLKYLPSTIKDLIKLRHLHVSNIMKLPAEIGRLTSLQALPAPFIVRDENGYKIEELGSLNNLKGSLTIGCLEKVHNKEEARNANLYKKSKLSELWLWWSITYCREEVERNDKNVLEGLQPHSNLKQLQVEGFDGKTFPEWILNMAVRNEPQGSWVGLNHLVEVKFYGCRECEEIPMLGHLPNLKSLYLIDLNNVKSITSSFYGIGEETGCVFPMLQTLELIYMPSLKEWAEVESGSTSEVKVFPRLQSLSISYCNQLIKAPVHAFSSPLKSLRISYCNQLTTDTDFPLLSKLTLLTDLVLEGLNRLQSLPDKLFYNNPNLIVLKISKCSKLGEIPDGLQTLNSLKSLIIQECSDLEKIKCSSGGRLTSLYELEINECPRLMDIPNKLLESSSAQVLKKVTLKGLSRLNTLPWPRPVRSRELAIEVWHFPNLYKLEIDVSMEGSGETSVATKKAVDRILQGCSSLRWLYLTGMEIWESLPESIQHLTSLDSLELNNFGMEELPEWFDRYISNIMSPSFSLKLSNCKRLRRLPSTEAMSRLIEAQNVVIEGCPEFHMNNNNIVLNSQDFLPTATVGFGVQVVILDIDDRPREPCHLPASFSCSVVTRRA